MIIVIDGPAASGKSSTARAVAQKMSIEYIDSGALYRAVTLLYVASTDRETFFKKLKDTSISFRYVNEQFEVFVNNKNVTSQLRHPDVSDKVSSVAAAPDVRSFVNELMRRTVRNGVYIAEGRDLGSVVFPDAEVKIFMQADLEERARRRFLELRESDVETTLSSVKQNILSRDKKDSNRQNDPLQKASDAIVIDTSEMKFDQQVQKICSIITTKTNINV